MGYVIASPWGACERSGILTFKHRASLRSGKIRISPHYYNSEAEMEETAQTLPS